jgi:hypothetical protein
MGRAKAKPIIFPRDGLMGFACALPILHLRRNAISQSHNKRNPACNAEIYPTLVISPEIYFLLVITP